MAGLRATRRMPSRGSAQQPLLRVADNPETIRPDLDRGGEAV